MTLNLDFTYDDKIERRESLRSHPPTPGFEMQDTIGGHSQPGTPSKKLGGGEKGVKAKEVVESNDSEEDVFVSREAMPLVKI